MVRDAAIGVDAGTGSARAGAFALDGTMLAQASRPLRLWRSRPDFAQQSTADISAAVVPPVRAALAGAGEEEGRGARAT